MFLALWEFEVKPGCEERFQTVYGAEGEWVRLFRGDPSFIETRLLKDPAAENKFVTVDFWESREAYESFKELNHAAYVAIDKQCESLTVSERCLGNFED
jgi:heme-degrading monooxygenase HmoA